MLRIVTLLAIAIVILLGVSFAYLNATPVTLHYYLGQQTLPFSLFLVIAFIVGAILGLWVGLWRFLCLKREVFRLRRNLTQAQQKLIHDKLEK